MGLYSVYLCSFITNPFLTNGFEVIMEQVAKDNFFVDLLSKLTNGKAKHIKFMVVPSIQEVHIILCYSVES